MISTIHIHLSPQRRNDTLEVERQGETLLFNGRQIDLASYDPTKTACEWIIGSPELRNDGWHVSVLLPHGPAAPETTRFPSPIELKSNGPVSLPDYGPKIPSKVSEGISRDIEFPNPGKFPKNESATLGNFFADPEALNAIPESHRCIATTIAYWAATDTTLRIFLQSRFGNDKKAASDLMEKLRTDDALSVGLKVAASLTGDREAQARTDDFLSLRVKVKKYRDAFAHGAWFLSGDHPNAVILAKADDYRASHFKAISELEDIRDFQGYAMAFSTWRSADFHLAANLASQLRNAAIELISQFR